MLKTKDIVLKISRSKDGKTVIKNFGYLSLLQFAGYLFPLITMPYLARVIGTDGFGKIAFASAVMVWIQTIADWGFNFTATRDVAQNRNDKDVVSQIFSNVLWARCLLTLLSGLVLAAITLFIPYFKANASIIFVTFLMVPGQVLFPDWFFQAIERMKYTTLFNIAIKLVFTIAVFVVIKEKDDYIYQPLLTTTGYVLCGMASLWLILKRWGYKLYKPNLHNILATIKSSTDVFINNLMPNLYNSFSVMLLGIWGGPVANGLYDGGNRFVNIFNSLLSVLSRAFFPFLSRRSEKHNVFALINLTSATLAALLLVLFAPLIVKTMLGPDFSESVKVLQVMSVSLVFLAMGNTYGTNYLIIHHQERSLRNITMLSSVIGMIIAFPLVKHYSFMGSAYVILICRGLLGISSYIKAKLIMRDTHK